MARHVYERSILSFDEPHDALDLARTFRLWLLDEFELHCAGGVDDKSAEFSVELENEDVAIRFESVTAETLRTEQPPEGMEIYWLSEREAALVEAHRLIGSLKSELDEARDARDAEAKKPRRKRKPPTGENRTDGHHADEN